MLFSSSSTYSCQECRRTFRWYDGMQYSFEFWDRNNPDSDDSCVMMYDAKWMDADCNWPRGYVCKGPGNFMAFVIVSFTIIK